MADKWAQYAVKNDKWDQYVEKPTNPVSTALKQTGEIISEAGKRTFLSGPTSFNNITGGIGTEFAHNVKGSTLERLGVAPWISEALSTATDPQSVLLPLTGGTSKVAMSSPGAIERLKSMKLSSEGRSAVSKLLPAADISTDLKANRPSSVQVEGFNIIKKTNNPVDVLNKFSLEKNNVIKEVDALVAQNNQPVDPKFLGSRVRLILDKKLKNSSPAERRRITDAVKTELTWISEQGEFDTVKANARKRYLYQETEQIQKRQNQNKQIITRPENDIVKDAFAQAYKEMIEKTHPDISKLNNRFAGLENGEAAATRLVEASQKQQQSGEHIATQMMRQPNKLGVISTGISKIEDLLKTSPTKRVTGKIEKLANKSADLLMESRRKQAPRLLDSFLNKQQSNKDYFREVLTLEDLNKLT